ncbi:MAG: hypothetical protein EBS24_01175 [Chitinophagia bacterium]|nr:hypothetical protein [Chitinophagia bacterium]
MKIIAFILLSIFSTDAIAQKLTGKELIERSCDYHDPNRLVQKKGIHLRLEEPRNEQEIRYTNLDINPAKGVYAISQEKGGNTVSYIKRNDTWDIRLNGSGSYTDQQVKIYRLTEDRAELLKNYYYYLWSLPCNLIDPAAQVDEDVHTRNFNEKQLLEVTVDYPTQSDSDTWRFYFNPESYALEGYMFFSSDSEGEYIFLDGEVKYKSLKIPSNRTWYDNHDDQFLATDKLVEISKYKKP